MLLKQSYNTISFPLDVKLPYIGRKLFKIYLKEFGFKKRLFFKTFASLMFNAIKDYFDGNLSEHQIQELTFTTWIQPVTIKFNKGNYIKKHNKLLSFFASFEDIVWNSESQHFPETLVELKKEWKELAEVYEAYFTTDKNILEKKNYPITLQTSTMRIGKKPLVATKDLEKHRA